MLRIGLCLLLLGNTSVAWSAWYSHFGYGLQAGVFRIAEPDDRTFYQSDVSLLNLSYRIDINRYYTYMNQISLNTLNIASNEQHIGQRIDYREISTGVERQFRLARQVESGLGIGVGISQTDYSRRHRVDSDGYLVQRLDDRQQIETSLNLSARLFRKLRRGGMGINLRSALPLNGGMGYLLGGLEITGR